MMLSRAIYNEICLDNQLFLQSRICIYLLINSEMAVYNGITRNIGLRSAICMSMLYVLLMAMVWYFQTVATFAAVITVELYSRVQCAEKCYKESKQVRCNSGVRQSVEVLPSELGRNQDTVDTLGNVIYNAILS